MTVHRAVYHYEVELKLVNENTKAERLVTYEEQAYSPFDAYMQATLKAAPEAGSAKITLVHVRPTQAAIAASQLGLAEAMSGALKAALAKGQDR